MRSSNQKYGRKFGQKGVIQVQNRTHKTAGAFTHKTAGAFTRAQLEVTPYQGTVLLGQNLSLTRSQKLGALQPHTTSKLSSLSIPHHNPVFDPHPHLQSFVCPTYPLPLYMGLFL
jgi:hypothetical protein